MKDFDSAYEDDLEDGGDYDEHDSMVETERAEWNRNTCSRLLLVFEYATSTMSMVKDLPRVLSWETRRRHRRDKGHDDDLQKGREGTFILNGNGHSKGADKYQEGRRCSRRPRPRPRPRRAVAGRRAC